MLPFPCHSRQTPSIDLNIISYWIWTKLLNSSQSSSPLRVGVRGSDLLYKLPLHFSLKKNRPRKAKLIGWAYAELRGGSKFFRPGALHMWLFSTHQLAELRLSHGMLYSQASSGQGSWVFLSSPPPIPWVVDRPDTQCWHCEHSHPGIKTTPQNRALTPVFC